MQICSYRLFSINNKPNNTSQIKSDLRNSSCSNTAKATDVFKKNCGLSFSSKVIKPKINILNEQGQRILDLDSFYKNLDESISKINEIISDKTAKKELLKKGQELELPVETALYNRNDTAASLIINAFAKEPDLLQKMLVPGLLNKSIAFKCEQTTKSIMKIVNKHVDTLAKNVILTPDYKGRLPIEEALDLGNDNLASYMINLVKEQSVISIFTERGILNKAIEKGCKNTVDNIVDITTKSPSIYLDMYLSRFPSEKEIPFNNLLANSPKNAKKVIDSLDNYPGMQDKLIYISCAECKNAKVAVKLLELISEKRSESINLYIPIIFNKNNVLLQRDFNNTFADLSGNKQKLLVNMFDKFMNDEAINKSMRAETFNHFPLKTTRLRLLADSLKEIY